MLGNNDQHPSGPRCLPTAVAVALEHGRVFSTKCAQAMLMMLMVSSERIPASLSANKLLAEIVLNANGIPFH